jgi:hypothetical protein
VTLVGVPTGYLGVWGAAGLSSVACTIGFVIQLHNQYLLRMYRDEDRRGRHASPTR